jgi:hypothetical protein
MRIASAYCVCISLVCFSHLHHHGVVDCILHVACCILVATPTPTLTLQETGVVACLWLMARGSILQCLVVETALVSEKYSSYSMVFDMIFNSAIIDVPRLSHVDSRCSSGSPPHDAALSHTCEAQVEMNRAAPSRPLEVVPFLPTTTACETVCKCTTTRYSTPTTVLHTTFRRQRRRHNDGNAHTTPL